MTSSRNSKTSLSLIGLNTTYPKRHIAKCTSSTHNCGQPSDGADGSTLADVRDSIYAEGSIVPGACSAFSLVSSCNCICICLSSLHIFTYTHSLFVGNISSSMISIIFRTCSIPKWGTEIIFLHYTMDTIIEKFREEFIVDRTKHNLSEETYHKLCEIYTQLWAEHHI